MIVMEPQALDLAELDGEPIRPIKRAEYELLMSQGYFESERVELLFGMVVTMPPIDPAHVEATNTLADILRQQLGGRARVLLDAAFAASAVSEPKPDVIVAPPGKYWGAHCERAYLVVEVARSSLRRDRGPKVKLYASAEVDEYWIVDHVNGRVEVFREATAGEWQVRAIHGRGETISMQRFPDVAIAVADVLPPQR